MALWTVGTIIEWNVVVTNILEPVINQHQQMSIDAPHLSGRTCSPMDLRSVLK